ncbi:threonine aldolase family protein [Natronoglycomyces albus]|uniref:Aminotransferase class I/II-fold pyridoxal phosphate-dependent enzyme n=1 Tax=Natronoglycomyces albus TaxID=2811108 RepID=A0A895XSA8_9ACTN|nr:GntG family PLP-dependent aldolase [Natronoglycomyces albus]QSB06562.1 aminotransferase class I/II-fold pyridoxal phosphate-dependent enzyme [Natronoglycomyces albus]
MVVDLRSDTVTKPSPQMLEAMAAADVGDDVYAEDPTVNALESHVAELFGHEAALFTPTGSMANQIALQTLVRPGEEVLCDIDAHIANYELGAAAAFGGISCRTWQAQAGRLVADQVEPLLNLPGFHAVPTKAIAVENTHNRGGGTVQPLDQIAKLRSMAEAHDIALHCDGARIWNAHVATGVSLAEYGRYFDTMAVCLSKGLGAPIGSLVISTVDRIEHARAIRKRLGGGMRQVGLLAAAGRYAIDHHLAGLRADHDRALRIAEQLEPFGICSADQVQTNIVVLRHPEIAKLAAQAGEKGVRISVLGTRWGRLLTHRDIDDAGVDRAVGVLTELLR